MATWDSQLFSQSAKSAGRLPAVIQNALVYADRITSNNPEIPVVFSLPHLAHLTGVPHSHLRDIVERRCDPYRSFLLKKRARPGSRSPARRYRAICVPEIDLMRIQRWINEKILAHVEPHKSSTAYFKNSSIVGAAKRHCKCEWLIKIDIHRFFESIPESSVYEVFNSLGYPELLSFEFSRLCTRAPSELSQRWKFKRTKIYRNGVHLSKGIGFLPQGAPTSPHLANLVMREFDEQVLALSTKHGLIYSRYADDLIFSTRDKEYGRANAEHFVRVMYDKLVQFGFEANRTKTMIIPPRSRKIVLGLLIDRDHPRLTRQFREKLETHAYFLGSPRHGPIAHAERRGFTSVIGLQNYINGLLACATQVDVQFANRMRARLEKVKWPI